MRELIPRVDALFETTPQPHPTYHITTIPVVLPTSLIQPTPEEVADITSMAISGYYMDCVKHHPYHPLSLLEQLRKCGGPRHAPLYLELQPFISQLLTPGAPAPPIIRTYLQLANFVCNSLNGYIHRIYQIHQHDWVDEAAWEQALHNINVTRTPASEIKSFESVVPSIFRPDELICWSPSTSSWHINGSPSAPPDLVEINGRVDMVEINPITHQEHIIEYKAVKTITYDHLMQLALYAWIIRTTQPTLNATFRLINIMDGQTITLKDPTSPSTLSALISLANDLINRKLMLRSTRTDEEFLAYTKGHHHSAMATSPPP
jgi:hypothetical protein